MDMFYTTLSKHNLVPQRRRMHFNAAMLEVQSVLPSSPDVFISVAVLYVLLFCAADLNLQT